MTNTCYSTRSESGEGRKKIVVPVVTGRATTLKHGVIERAKVNRYTSSGPAPFCSEQFHHTCLCRLLDRCLLCEKENKGKRHVCPFSEACSSVFALLYSTFFNRTRLARVEITVLMRIYIGSRRRRNISAATMHTDC